jgi:hypothetical protein
MTIKVDFNGRGEHRLYIKRMNLFAKDKIKRSSENIIKLL